MTGVEETPECRVIYVPGGPRSNRIHYPENTIVLDEALQDDPVVHDYILEHERRHAEIGYDEPQDWLRQLKHEFRMDVHRHLGTDESARALRNYSTGEKPSLSDLVKEAVHEFLFGFLRAMWQVPLLLARPLRAIHEHRLGGEDA